MQFFCTASRHMQDINPLRYLITDLQGRIESLRGYL
jgi:hypothetical protein